jgi:exopolysaccharide production protein ExoZ
MAERNRSLDGLRGIAVLLTFLVHYFGTYMATFRGANPNVVAFAGWVKPFDRLMFWLFHSHHGVYIFFLLSGYLIAKIATGRSFAYGKFVRNRIIRIYPAFLLALVICLLVGQLLGIAFPGWRNLAFNLLFLNGFPGSGVAGIVFNNVTWSLFYEMVFYLSFPLVLMAGQRLRIPNLAMVILAGIVFAYGPGVAGLYFEFFIFLFAGAVVGLLPQNAVKTVAATFPDAITALLYVISTSLFTAGYLVTSQFVWLFAGTGIIILCKAIDGNGIIAKGLAWGPLAALGRISYSFYLLHSVALATIFTYWWRFNVPLFGVGGNLIYVGFIGFIGATGLAWVSYMVAERFYFQSREPVQVSTVQEAPVTP